MSRPHVTVERKVPVTKASGSMAFSACDICLTPVGPQMVPMPYVNTAPSSHLRNGSTAVRVAGASVMLADSTLSPSTGNELGTGGGIRSRVTRGPVHPLQVSVTVTIEGQGVARESDITLHNGKNAVGALRRG